MTSLSICGRHFPIFQEVVAGWISSLICILSRVSKNTSVNVTTNKVRLQQFFINWVCENYKDQRPVYLGGSHENDLSACLRVTDGRGNYVRLLKCDCEEADDRIMLHVNHAVIADQFKKIIIASADTDVFICLMYHFRRWNELDLKELWVISGQGCSARALFLYIAW